MQARHQQVHAPGAPCFFPFKTLPHLMHFLAVPLPPRVFFAWKEGWLTNLAAESQGGATIPGGKAATLAGKNMGYPG